MFVSMYLHTLSCIDADWDVEELDEYPSLPSRRAKKLSRNPRLPGVSKNYKY
jgi:hypothetical protein